MPPANSRDFLLNKIMKNTIILIAICAVATCATAKGSGSKSGSNSHAVRGHVTKKGTYVAPTRATNPDGSKRNNYSQKGNINPANGKEGTKQ